ncbi:MAG: UDP-glucose/GDP-mannose dehydrogenase family protein, partial [Nitrospira sp. SB0672_bin_25]|nr:UDP-glucose/GDP-mannose dehydrogenase family protein [Nitrospira sp. SB0672_bin_25]
MHISVLGTGYVGLVTGSCFAEFGLNVTCMDVDAGRVQQLERGEVPFYEPGLAALVAKGLQSGRLTFTTDLNQALDTALVIFIAVGTPSNLDGSADLSYMDEVARSIGSRMTGYKVVATKSTVPVGTATRVREIIKAHQSKPVNFDVAANPEFLREGSAIEDFMRPDRVVIGVESEQAAAILKDLYRPLYLIETPFVVTTVQTAEVIKYASNVFLATKISFINEVANLCELVDANVQTVAKAMGLDKRIGSKFLHAGPGFGGSCFGKDTAALVHIGETAGYAMKLAATTKRVNEQQR